LKFLRELMGRWRKRVRLSRISPEWISAAAAVAGVAAWIIDRWS
jgi:hypothetical protein